jgi:hypothetical protein
MHERSSPTAIFILAFLLTIVSGCAAHPDPIIDMKGVDEEAMARDWDECEAYTDEIIIGKGVAKSSVYGGAVGAVSGAINGDVGRGAANGALWGGAKGGLNADRDKQKVFKRCMSGRGYRVLN